MPAGGIVWQDLITSDPKAAHDFYSRLFDWSIEVADIPDYGVVRMIYANQTAIGTIESMPPDSTAPSHWLPYILVPDSVDAACERAVAAGATMIQSPMEHQEFGRYAVLSDPDGARFAPFEYLAESEFTAVSPEWDPQPGSISWYAISGVNGADTARFYATVFGYDPVEESGEDVTDDHIVLQTGEQMHAGVLGHGGSMTSQWLFYVAVEDIGTIGKRATALGGQIATPMINIPGIGQIVGLTDPNGTTIFAHQPQ